MASEIVSVIIPTHNRVELLKKAIDSVNRQTWHHNEIIVVDDASQDSTPLALKELQKITLLSVIRNASPKGGGYARNQGIEAAKGHFVAFLDDDDTWLPTKLEKQIALFETVPNSAAVTCSYWDVYTDKTAKKIHITTVHDEQKLLTDNYLGGASMLLTTKKMLTLCGGFNHLLKSGQDWDLWIKLWRLGPILVCDEPLVNYLSHANSRISNNKLSVYEGRRKIYAIYKDRMTYPTRIKNWAILIANRLR